MASINCVLNDKFLEARRAPHFEEKRIKTRNTYYNGDAWYSQSTWLVNKKTEEKIFCLSDIQGESSIQCCGIDELDFRSFGILIDGDENPIYRHDYFDEIIAKLIDTQCSHKDQRVLILGLPTSVGENSDYSIVVYEKIRKILLSFGFVELCKEPYKNKNSGNFITVLAGQMPE